LHLPIGHRVRQTATEVVKLARLDLRDVLVIHDDDA